MENTPTIQKITADARQLSHADLITLIDRLTEIAEEKQGEPAKKRSILEFQGIAEHARDEEDPTVRIRRMRDED